MEVAGSSKAGQTPGVAVASVDLVDYPARWAERTTYDNVRRSRQLGRIDEVLPLLLGSGSIPRNEVDLFSAVDGSG